MARARVFPIDDPDDFVEFSIVPNEGWNGQTDISSHPVEKGEDVANHIQPKPDGIQIRARFSNYDDLTEDQVGDDFAGVTDRIFDKIQTLTFFRKNGILLTYQGHNRTETDLLIAKIGEAITVKGGDGLDVVIQFTKFRIAQTITKEAAAPVTVQKTKGKGRVNKEKTDVPGGNEEESETNTSLLKGVFG